jgi:hypothetical protein
VTLVYSSLYEIVHVDSLWKSIKECVIHALHVITCTYSDVHYLHFNHSVALYVVHVSVTSCHISLHNYSFLMPQLLSDTLYHRPCCFPH